jgi:hypothetical protein
MVWRWLFEPKPVAYTRITTRSVGCNWMINKRKYTFITENTWNVTVFLLKGPAADATDAPQPWRLIVHPCEKDDEDNFFSAFPF